MGTVLKEIQRKYHNNRVAAEGYIKATIKQQDCPVVDAEYYVATMPAGVIIKGVSAYLTGEYNDTDTASINVTIGDNECVLCDTIPQLDLNPNTATCVEDCKCLIVKKDYLIKVVIVEAPEVSDINLLFEVVMPEHIICSVKPIRLCTGTVIKPYCVAGDCECGSCQDDDGCGCN